MKAKITLRARVADGGFVNVEIKKGVPVAPEGATSYYARYIKDGKRYSQPLGKELAAAFITYKNLEMAREFRNRDLALPAELAIQANQPSKLVADLAAQYPEQPKNEQA